MTAVIQRRRFLASSSVAISPLVGAGAAEVSAAARSDGSLRETETWHLLAVAPQSRKVTDLESDYRRGVELGLAQQADISVKLHWMSAHAVPGKAARNMVERLENMSLVHGVFGWMPPELERRAAALTQARGLPLWVSDTGADYRTGQDSAHGSGAQKHHSLALCDCAERLAREVMNHQGSRAVLAVGWMEAGYDFVAAFHHAYRALGGQIVGRHAGGPQPQSHEFDGLRNEIFNHRPDAVVAFYSGPQAQRFVQWWQKHAQGQGAWKLAGLPWLMEAGAATDSITVDPWLSSGAADPLWVTRFQQSRLSWTAAAVLGAEAGYSIGLALSGKSPSNSVLKQAWAETRIQGPRGGGYGMQDGLRGLPAQMTTPSWYSSPQLSSGWLSGYLQT